MAITPGKPPYTVIPHRRAVFVEDTETDAIMKAIVDLTGVPGGYAGPFDPVGYRCYDPRRWGWGMGKIPLSARVYGADLPAYADAPMVDPYFQAGLAAAAHGPHRSELTEAVQAFTSAASALRDIADNAAKTLALTQEAADPGEWNIKAAKEKLSQVFDQALVQPQRVTRRGGDAVILVEESRYNALTQAAASADASMLDAFKAPALRGANLPEIAYPEPLAV